MQKGIVLKEFTVPGHKRFKPGDTVTLEEGTFGVFADRGLVELINGTKMKKMKEVNKKVKEVNKSEEPKKKDA